MNTRELKILSQDVLISKLDDLRKQLMELEFKRQIGVEKPHLFKEIKKDIARILTLLREKTQINAEKGKG